MSRARKLTEKASELFHERVSVYVAELLRLDKQIDEVIAESETVTEMHPLRDYRNYVDSKYKEYSQVHTEFVTYLQHTRTVESMATETQQQNITDGVLNKVQKYMKSLNDRIRTLSDCENIESASMIGSKNSRHSSVSSLLMKQCAKAEAAKTRLKFAEKESELQRQQTELEISRKLLASQCEAEEAQVELDAMQNLIYENTDHKSDMSAKIKQMENFVETQKSILKLPMSQPRDTFRIDNPPNLGDQKSHYALANTKAQLPVVNTVKGQATGETTVRHVLLPGDNHTESQDIPNVPQNVVREVATQQVGNVNPARTSVLNPSAQPYIPEVQKPVPTPADQFNMCAELSKYLMKKDLLLSRFSKFNDRPEYFATWQNSFNAIVHELGVSPQEEMDLLVKWLGTDSSKQAASIRAANAHDPVRALHKIWERLENRYGSPELVESELKKKLFNFPKLSGRDHSKLFDLADIVSEIESVKCSPRYSTLLAYYDSSAGVSPIVSKLPPALQEKWTSEAVRYKEHHDVAYPPFNTFSDFLCRQARIRNDPSFLYDTQSAMASTRKSTSHQNSSRIQTDYKFTSKKTDVSNEKRLCPYHETSEGHTLNYCKGFRRLPIKERRDFLTKQKICFRCCESTTHAARTCEENISCFICKSDKHPTAMHIHQGDETARKSVDPKPPSKKHGGEGQSVSPEDRTHSVTSTCTLICEKLPGGKSCSKTVLVKVSPIDRPDQSLITYAILDDQSNKSLARTDLFNAFNERGQEIEYTLSSCNGSATMSGRRASGYMVESLDGSNSLHLPTLIECNEIPNVRDEIPTPEAAANHPHMKDIAEFIPPVNLQADVLLLIGRDLPTAHHVLDQRLGPSNAPYAQKMYLGWVIVGEVCLGKVHQPEDVIVRKTHILRDGRTSIMPPCTNNFDVREKGDFHDIFIKTDLDETQGPSVEDKQFLNLMDSEFTRDVDGYWTAPLPFRPGRQTLPYNKPQAVHRAELLDKSLRKDPTKCEHMITFMSKIVDKGHAQVAKPLPKDQECWYLPLFGVYNAKKPGSIRGVFDSSAKYNGVSLNNVLMTGPDLINNLLGILLRFRTESVAVMADVEQMFYCFKVNPSHRDFLRFIWYKDNDPSQEMIEYRMTTHVFGNSPSPAVATYGLRKSVESADDDVKEFVSSNFYVDDGLLSVPTPEMAIDIVHRTQAQLKEGGNIRLHKIASNNQTVLASFDAEDLAKDIKDMDLSTDTPPVQRSLGLAWNISRDTFTFQVNSEQKSFTKRGVLSTIHSLYDPIGFTAPVVIKGRLLLRELMDLTTDWDDPLPSKYLTEWRNWCDSLSVLESVAIPRVYSEHSFSQSDHKEIHLFSDASKEAVGAVAYLKIYDINNSSTVSFLLGKAKVAPRHGHTIPRLELCAAVLSVEMADMLTRQLRLRQDCLRFYTDSRVVLGYIHNEKRRFHVYVANRVDRIRRSSHPHQWNYVSTDTNPADQATRSLRSSHLQDSLWLNGPDLLRQETCNEDAVPEYSLVDPQDDKEVKAEVIVSKTSVDNEPKASLDTERFSRFSSWKRLVSTISLLRHILKSFHTTSDSCKGWHKCRLYRTVSDYAEAERAILRLVQREWFSEEITCLQTGKCLPRKSLILSLSPILDEYGLLRVGGRLKNSELPCKEIQPIIIPKNHHAARLLIQHFHERVCHQGRHFTEGALRSGGYWIVGAKRLVSSLISKCVTCRKLRCKPETQMMSDLPFDRITPCPPFTFVGVDAFGPWEIVTRRTRGGAANTKRWAILFTCLVIRAVHIDLVEEMSSSSFINCLRRFQALRGDVKQFRSDRGTNFVGCTEPLDISAVNVEDGPVHNFLYENGVTWMFNAPHSSHMGGAWERMIGTARRILNAMLLDVKTLTHEVLSTLMAEVTAIINARPITVISTDPEVPTLLSPAMILTQKNIHASNFNTTLDAKDMYRAQWRQVQTLAEEFWRRWRSEYLQNLQRRPKWQVTKPNLQVGNIVLMKDSQSARNEWPMGRIDAVYPEPDGLVRKVAVRVCRDSKSVTYIRPVTDLVRLL